MSKPELHAAQEREGDVQPAASPSSAFSFSPVVAAMAAVMCKQKWYKAGEVNETPSVGSGLSCSVAAVLYIRSTLFFSFPLLRKRQFCHLKIRIIVLALLPNSQNI